MSKGKIKIVFIHGEGLVSETIRNIQKLKATVKDGFIPSHCGIIVDECYGEALIDGFQTTAKYCFDPAIVRVYEIDIPDMESCRAKFHEITGRAYGWLAVWNGLIYTVAGIITEGDGEKTGDCSEYDTRIIRAGGIDILPGLPADAITPLILMEAVQKIGNLVLSETCKK